MANEIQTSCKFTVTKGVGNVSLSPSSLLSLSSSYSYAGEYFQYFNTGSWVALNTGSATHTQVLVLCNQSISGSVITVSNSNNISGSFHTMLPNGFCYIQPPASASYYVNATSGSGQATLQIGIAE